MAAIFVSDPVPLPSLAALGESPIWEVSVQGFDQSGPSFEARVFLNNPNANPNTPKNAEAGYAGSIHIFGYGLSREASPRLPMDRSVDATEAIRRQLLEGQKQATVTVVPVMSGTRPNHEAPDDFDIGIAGVEITPKPNI